MDIWELQERCRAVAGEADERRRRRAERLESMGSEPLPRRRWLSEEEWEAKMAEQALAYYAHVSEFEGRPRSEWRRKPKKRK